MAVPLKIFWLSLCAPLKFRFTDRIWLNLVLFCIFVEAKGPKRPKVSARGCRQTLAFSIRTSDFLPLPPRPTTRRRNRRGKRRWRDKRRMWIGACGDTGEWGALFIGTRTGPFTGGAARTTARAVRVLVRARAPDARVLVRAHTPDAPQVPRARAPARTPAQCPHSRTRVPTRTRADKRRWLRDRKYDGRCTRLGSSRQE